MKRTHALLVLTVVLISSPVVRGDDSSSGILAKLSAYKKGVLEVIDVFPTIRSAVKEFLIGSAERDQALRYLRALSHRLAVLALEKENFAREVKLARFPDNRGTLVDHANDLEDAIWKVRRSLVNVFESLPDKVRPSTKSIEEKLYVRMNSKLETLDKVAEFVEAPGASREEIVQRIKDEVEVTRKLKAEVDALIAELSQAQ